MLKAFGFSGPEYVGLCSEEQKAYPHVLPGDFLSMESLEKAENCLNIPESDDYRHLVLILSGMLHSHDEYAGNGIGDDIYFDTMSDSFIWAELHRRLTGKIGLRETSWLLLHINLELFRLGRLQFQKSRTPDSFTPFVESEEVIGIHIPDIGPLEYEECLSSLERARSFYRKDIPFVCDSWLLDPELSKVLSENSNILKFQSLFDIVAVDKSNPQCHQRVFEYSERKNTTLQKRILEEEKKGSVFGVGYGIMR